MTTPNDPNVQTLRPEGLVNQLFDAALLQYKADPRKAAQQVVIFLTEAIIYAIDATASDDNSRKAFRKNVGDTIITAPALVNTAAAPQP